jgi:hypothetical protein
MYQVDSVSTHHTKLKKGGRAKNEKKNEEEGEDT